MLPGTQDVNVDTEARETIYPSRRGAGIACGTAFIAGGSVPVERFVEMLQDPGSELWEFEKMCKSAIEEIDRRMVEYPKANSTEAKPRRLRL